MIPPAIAHAPQGRGSGIIDCKLEHPDIATMIVRAVLLATIASQWCDMKRLKFSLLQTV
jgi:hypothetical protein